MVEMKNFFKGLAYTVFAGLVGLGGYLIGKYKHMGGKVSLTMIGLAAVLYAPRGCDVLETYIERHSEVEKVRVLGDIRKDSLDAVMMDDANDLIKKDLERKVHMLKQSQDSLDKTYRFQLNEVEERYSELMAQKESVSSTITANVVEGLMRLENTIDMLSGSERETPKGSDAQPTGYLSNSGSDLEVNADGTQVSGTYAESLGTVQQIDMTNPFNWPKYRKIYYGNGKIELQRIDMGGYSKYGVLEYGPRLSHGLNARKKILKNIKVEKLEEIMRLEEQYGSNDAFWYKR